MWPDNGEMNISLLGYQSSKVASSVATWSYNPMWNNLPYNALEVADATTHFHIYTRKGVLSLFVSVCLLAFVEYNSVCEIFLVLWTSHEIKMFVGPDEARALERRILIRIKDGENWKEW